MFNFFKKQPTVLDAAIHMIYGPNPPRKTADAQRAANLASGLLRGRVGFSEIKTVTDGLDAGPMPYSTHDLAASVALNFFRRKELMSSLAEAQIPARMQVFAWFQEGHLNPNLARMFEDSLYKDYKPFVTAAEVKPAQQETPRSDDVFSDADFDAVEAKFEAFRRQHAGKEWRDGIALGREFVNWQQNQAELAKFDVFPDGNPTDEQLEHARQVERAFWFGVARTVIHAYAVPQKDYTLFLQNFVGRNHGFGGDIDQVTAAIANEVVLMREATDSEEDSDRFGCFLMKDFLVNGKDERKRLFLAHLQKKCWGDLSE